VRSRGVATDVREIEVLRNQEATGPLRCAPFGYVVTSGQPFRWNGVDVVTE